MKFWGSVLLVLASAIPAFAGSVTFTCNSNIDADGPSTLCAFLNSTIDPLYNNTFTNANASIYIEFANNHGLADSTSGFYNLVTYATYQNALQSLSTDAAEAFVPGTEPSIFGSDQVELTSALAEALNITTVANGNSVVGTTTGGSSCTDPGGSGCYNGIIQLNFPSDLKSEYDQGYTYRTLGGSTTGTTSNYDVFSVIEHEADEILGTISCIETTADNNTALANPQNCVSAVDLFRYTSSGTRTFDTVGATAYFSPDGGVTDFQGNLYNDLANGEDWADFSNSCTFVQDAVGCLNQTFDITTDGTGGGPGPEVAILNAVGYNLTPTPEPTTVGMLGLGFAGLIALARRRRSNRAAASTTAPAEALQD